MSSDPKMFYTPEEIAYHTGKSVKWVALMRSKGGGPPFIKMGKYVFYPRDRFNEWLKSKEQTIAQRTVKQTNS